MAIFKELAKGLGIDMEDTAHMGDDVNDLPLMRSAGISIATSDAVQAVYAESSIVTSRRGGDAAVREVCEAILAAQGKLIE